MQDNLTAKFGEALEAIAGQLDQADVFTLLDQAVTQFGERSDPDAMFDIVFSFFERHPEADLGSPGPLVHLVERFYPRYLEKLQQSTDRRPTHYTIWMVNRILNSDLAPPMRSRLLDCLRAVSIHPAASGDERQLAVDFLARQSS